MGTLFSSFQINILVYLFAFWGVSDISLEFKPPGTTKLKGVNFYVDKTEITNADWAEYLYYLKKEYGILSKEYKSALPDSIVWLSVYSGDINSLSLNCKYKNYPIVGISYKQAVQYCKWRSEVVNMKYKKYKTTYNLPSVEEWGKIYKLANKKGVKSSLYPYHYKKIKGVAGLCDNVSEMTSEPKIAIGGNWKNNKKCNDKIKYNSPKNWLGFRCIAYYKKKMIIIGKHKYLYNESY